AGPFAALFGRRLQVLKIVCQQLVSSLIAGIQVQNPGNQRAHELLADYFEHLQPATEQSRERAGWHRSRAAALKSRN
ncbi:MAG: hypothetical protein ACKPHU_13875, partial [Planctomycetaceae bacterium]